ncbi:2-acylglycerophosphoethanolamine acyltransferase [Legionella donaldsonii]|uniref:2-acylglycerophosphoethanolamine acyltransferase n=2 Tax=Legionella donaldsonii TaxID=45060 RepID=A0A378J916_9GAMM|nr:2-acylglycerophosphoethanolamine acyltransferase [Legionella donaldsonii]
MQSMAKQRWQFALSQACGWLIKKAIKKWFCLKIQGHYELGADTVIVINRTSAIDALLLAFCFPERLTFILPVSLAKKGWFKVLRLFSEVRVNESGGLGIVKSFCQAVQEGKHCVLFPPEYSTYLNDEAMVELAGLMLKKAQASVLPVRIDGTQYSIFSLVKDKHLTQWRPKVTLHVMAPRLLTTQDAPQSRKRVGRELFLLLSEMSFTNWNRDKSLFAAMLQGVKLAKKSRQFMEDSTGNSLSTRRFISSCFILGRQFKNQTQAGERVGLMMPTSIAALVSFFALQAYRRIPAMLNFSGGFYNLYAACQLAGIKTIYTSRQFIITAKLEGLLQELLAAGLELIFLEDSKAAIGLADKITGLLKGFFPLRTYVGLGDRVAVRQTAVILFTSGSEGVPKGVALSHANILANCYQLISRVDFSAADVFLNALPIFHCFGLTVGCLLPLFTGNRCFFYPSPLHYKIIPSLVYDKQATIFLSTGTFLTGYARVAKPRDFGSVRYVFAGAEKVKPETIQNWKQIFGVSIYEGYGATEASPVIALNCSIASKIGSVGLPLPGIQYRVEAMEGISEGGRLFIRGPNVMAGYLSPNCLGEINHLKDGWHDTGDIVSIDDNGFVSIKGRVKRFAKLGGEMVSLTAVESIAAVLWPGQTHAALYQQCPKKGEQILLFSEAPLADKSTFVHYIHTLGHSELLIPHKVFPATKIPVLTTGKIDYVTLERELTVVFSS